MCKTLAILMIPIMLVSCSTVKDLTHLEHHEENKVHQSKLEKEKEGFTQVDGEFIPNQQLATPDSTKTIIVYNVVESDKGKKGLSDETWRSFIAQFFGTISTIFALIYGTSQNP
jgi:hypothetical protein